MVHRGNLSYGPVTLSSEKVKLDTHMETAAGSPASYPGTLHDQTCQIHPLCSHGSLKVSSQSNFYFHSPPFAEGFTTVAMLSYSNLEKSADGYFSAMEPQEAESFKINSRVMTISVSNRNTSRLDQPVKLTFNHLEQVANILSNISALWSNVSPLKKRGRKWWRVGRRELFLSFCY